MMVEERLPTTSTFSGLLLLMASATRESVLSLDNK
jgi:hypothetical protein